MIQLLSTRRKRRKKSKNTSISKPNYMLVLTIETYLMTCPISTFLNMNKIMFPLLLSEFAKEKERVESRAGFMALKEQQKLEKELTGYVDWICR